MQLTALFAAFVLFLTGRIEAAPLAFLQEARQGTSLEAEKKELAAIRLIVAAERKFKEAKERLLALDQKLSTSTDVDARALRTELGKLLTDVRRALGETTPADGKGKIDDAVRKAIRDGDFAFVQQLGAAAATALAEAVREAPDTLPTDHGRDPFYHLLGAAPDAAAALCDELGDAGYFWKKRVLRALAGNNYFGNAGAWTADGNITKPARNGLVRQLELAFDEPDLVASTLWHLRFFFEREVMTPRLRDAFLAALKSRDAKVREQAWERVQSPSFKLTSVLLDLLGSTDPEVRSSAASALANKDGDPALLDLAKEADPGLRWCAAKQLELLRGAWGERELTLLGDLLLDGTEFVAGQALEAWSKQPEEVLVPSLAPGDLVSETTQLSRRLKKLMPRMEAFRALARAENENLRSRLSRESEAMPASFAFELQRDLAKDDSPGVVTDALAAAGKMACEDPRAMLAVVDQALSNPKIAREDALRPLFAFGYGNLRLTHSGRAELWRWIARRGESELVQPLVNAPEVLEDLPPENVPAICRVLYEADPGAFESLIRGSGRNFNELVGFQLRHVDGLRSVTRDASAPAGLRLLANRRVPPLGPDDKAWVENVIAILSDPFWRGVARKPIEWESCLASVIALADDAQANAVLLGLLELPGLEPSLLGRLFEGHLGFSPSVAPIVQKLLGRFYEVPEGKALASVALSRMGSSPALADKAWLERAVRDGRLRAPALSAIGRLRDPAFLPLLDETLRASNDLTVIRAVVDALTGYLSNEAGELLLLAATKLSGEDRDAALAHLKKIREYQDARAEWATRKTSRETRGQVVAELVAKLDAKSEEVKVEAIRALATWEAVEAMPRLIELTQSGSKSVAAAARAALERLNAPKETTGG